MFEVSKGEKCVHRCCCQEERACWQALYDGELDALQIAEAGVGAAIQFDQYTGAPIESHVIDLIESKQVAELERLLKV